MLAGGDMRVSKRTPGLLGSLLSNIKHPLVQPEDREESSDEEEELALKYEEKVR